MKLIIGNKNYSSWSMRPWLLLKQFNQPFEEQRIALFTDGFKEQITHFSGAGKVPILVDGELIVWDSLAICEYISEQYLSGKGYPEDKETRAVARAVVSEMHSGFMQIRERMPMNCRAATRTVSMDDAINNEIKRVEDMWGNIRKAHKDHGPWLFGQFSIADCMFAPMALRFRTYGVALQGEVAEYQQQLLHWDHVKLWVEQGAAEKEVIAINEAGSE